VIATIERESPNVVSFELTGKLHDSDYKQFVPTMEAILTAMGRVRLFIRLKDFHGWDLHAAWDDFQFRLNHYADFERIALVGDRKWEKWMASFIKPFTKANVKYFDKSEVDAAWKWLEENDECNRPTKGRDRLPEVPDNSDIWNAFPWYGP